MGSGSTEASGYVVVTTGYGSETSGAAGTGKMGTLVLCTAEGSADTGGDVTLNAGSLPLEGESVALVGTDGDIQDGGSVSVRSGGSQSSRSGSVLISSPTSAGVVGPINIAKGRGFMEYNTVHEQTAINADIEHYVMGDTEGILLIGLTLIAKSVETIGCTSCTCSQMSTLTQTNFLNGIATSTCTDVLLCVAVPPSCMQTLIDIHLFVLNSKHGRSDVMV